MNENNWSLITKFFKIELSAKEIYGYNGDIQIVFECDGYQLKVPRDEDGNICTVTFGNCLRGKYGNEIKEAAKAMKEKSENLNEPLEKLEKDFSNAQKHFIDDVNRLRAEAELPLL